MNKKFLSFILSASVVSSPIGGICCFAQEFNQENEEAVAKEGRFEDEENDKAVNYEDYLMKNIKIINKDLPAESYQADCKELVEIKEMLKNVHALLMNNCENSKKFLPWAESCLKKFRKFWKIGQDLGKNYKDVFDNKQFIKLKKDIEKTDLKLLMERNELVKYSQMLKAKLFKLRDKEKNFKCAYLEDTCSFFENTMRDVLQWEEQAYKKWVKLDVENEKLRNKLIKRVKWFLVREDLSVIIPCLAILLPFGIFACRYFRR